MDTTRASDYTGIAGCAQENGLAVKDKVQIARSEKGKNFSRRVIHVMLKGAGSCAHPALNAFIDLFDIIYLLK
jgi:hypothetical protein